MNYNITDTLILENDTLCDVLFDESKFLFINDFPEVIEEWQDDLYTSHSFQKLLSFLTERVYPSKPITKLMIREAVINYKGTIIQIVSEAINASSNDSIKTHAVSQDGINELLESEFIYTNAGVEYQMVRDIVTKRKNFKEDSDGTLRAPVTDYQGNQRGLAEIKGSKLTEQEMLIEKQELWFDLIDSTTNSLDELTADLFDLITYLWMVSPKNKNGYITFHSDYALALKKLKKVKQNSDKFDFRNEDRYSIMQRIGALTSIWVMLDDKSVQIYNEDTQLNEDIRIKDFQKMFDVGKVSIASDSKTGKNLGIYSVEIKPSELLTPFLDGTKGTLGILALKIFQYSHYHQREHKRLIRYLSYQWKIQSIKRNYQPFKVATLIKHMEISSRYTGIKMMERFENVLDDLQKDQIFDSWNYTEEIDHKKIGKKGWINNYWSKLNIMIEPNEAVKQENKKRIDLFNNQLLNMIHGQDIIGKPIHTVNKNKSAAVLSEQQSFDFEPNTPTVNTTIELSPDNLKKAIKKNKTNAKRASKDMGVPYSTLLRFIKGESKRSYKDNEDKMMEWLKNHS
ncbi:hypothetical protein [Bacillus sp. 1P06AnD]|uniref:hypothetical protein n=1 Tax=Bacillus sp. 1P06AnD TaxID=3132208 RepID=UPI0039A0965E